jgi:hypothetical protein
MLLKIINAPTVAQRWFCAKFARSFFIKEIGGTLFADQGAEQENADEKKPALRLAKAGCLLRI